MWPLSDPYRPHPLLKSLHRQSLSTKQFMYHRKTALSPLCHFRFHRHHISKRRRHVKIRASLHQRYSRNLIFPQHLRLGNPGRPVKQRIRASIEILQIPWKKHNPKRIAISPLNLYLSLIFQIVPALPHFRKSFPRESIASRNTVGAAPYGFRVRVLISPYSSSRAKRPDLFFASPFGASGREVSGSRLSLPPPISCRLYPAFRIRIYVVRLHL